MSVSSVQSQTGSAGPAGNPTGATSGLGALGKQDFLMLLVAQLQNQDPLQPTDDKQFMAQLAQFSTLEQMQQMNQTLTQMSELSMLGQAAGLVGKQVTATDPSTDTPIQGTVSEVTIQNGAPKLMVNGASIDLANVTAIGVAPSSA